jgi:hypothetical protein
MKHLRKRLTYANVMSSIAVFLVVAGGSALAATTIGKNTIGTKQLKNNAVTSAKIKNGAVTGAKVNVSSLGKVPSAASADTATTANTAATAATATTAAKATNAENLGGRPAGAFQSKVRWALVSPTGAIIRQSGGISAEGGAGIYELDFGSNESNAALTGNTVDNGTAGGPLSLMSCADSGSAGFGTCVAEVNPNVVKVVTTNATGAITARTFYLSAAG